MINKKESTCFEPVSVTSLEWAYESEGEGVVEKRGVEHLSRDGSSIKRPMRVGWERGFGVTNRWGRRGADREDVISSWAWFNVYIKMLTVQNMKEWTRTPALRK